ncbi:type II toxin-antitoxin system RelE/ParE family toxin [Geotalea toluenoxydans]|uniref:type II toxin-antitoxin system RelE/ParE family toxin n=1 Tax=Geotalea toluenoxydans TaxID=421624 RepID=UPI0006CFED9D|nr:type II toxin-antitoxin system RelE/ParE family toxin [Geotalea toluenoxydans]
MRVKYNVQITPAAERDVEEIWIYIADDSPENANAFIIGVEEQITTLEQLPERCPLIPENEQLGTAYRQLLYGAYRTIFRIAGKTVYILRIIHSSRLLDSSCFED